MKQAFFDDLMSSAQEALEHARGKRALRTTVLPAPPAPMTAADIRAIREGVNASQAVFAHYLNVSTKLVQAWEAGRRSPEGAALRLLRLGEDHPELIFASPPSRLEPAGSATKSRRRAAKRASARRRVTRPALKR
jgi:putative transcriptional regulator